MNWVDQFITDLDKKSQKDAEWYVSVSDGAEGPFNSSELQIYIIEKKLSGKTQVWNKTMPEWQNLSDVGFAAGDVILDPQVKLNSLNLTISENAQADQNLNFWIGQQRTQLPFFKRSQSNKKQLPMLAVAGSLAVCIIGGVIYFMSRADDFTDLRELTSEQNRELRMAHAEPAQSGLTGAIQLMGASTPFPRFAIAANVPNTQQLILTLNGIQGTLIGASKYKAVMRLTIQDGLLLTNPITNSKGEGLPVGEYEITLTCESCPDQKMGLSRTVKLADKKIFIGGEKNFDYDEKLRAFHFQLKGQARQELIYFKQLSDALLAHYEQLKLIRTKEGVGPVDATSSRLLKNWNDTQTQYQLEFQNLADRYKRGELFYDKFASELLNLFSETSVVYAAKMSQTNPTEIIRLNLQFKDHHAALDRHRDKLENLPLTANGRPRTE